MTHRIGVTAQARERDGERAVQAAVIRRGGGFGGEQRARGFEGGRGPGGITLKAPGLRLEQHDRPHEDPVAHPRARERPQHAHGLVVAAFVERLQEAQLHEPPVVRGGQRPQQRARRVEVALPQPGVPDAHDVGHHLIAFERDRLLRRVPRLAIFAQAECG